LKKSALLYVALLGASFALVSCNGGVHITLPPSKVMQRVFASQNASSPTAFAQLVIVNGEIDALARGGISAGPAPGLMAISPDRSVVLAFSTTANSNTVAVVNTSKESSTGNIQLAGSTTSMVVPSASVGYAAVPAAPINGQPAGGVVAMNLASGAITATFSVPNAQTVVSNSSGSQLLVFSNDSDSLTILYPLLLNLGPPVSVTVPACTGCRPVNAVFSSDGSTAYILNCGTECGGSAPPNVQILNVGATPPALGASVAVDGATDAFLSGTTLYVVGNSLTNNLCTGESTAAPTCGRLDLVNVGSMTVISTAVITDGYHDRIDMSVNGQLIIGSYGCTNVGNVNNPQGEVRGCLSIFNTSNGAVVIPPDNGDVTGLQSFTTRDVEYVVEGGNLRVYDTLTDSLLLDNSNDTNIPETGTVIITGYVVDVKAVDFF
jgi:hypothetical protein